MQKNGVKYNNITQEEVIVWKRMLKLVWFNRYMENF